MVPILVAVIVQGMRHLRTCRWEGKPVGRFLVRAIVVISLLMMPVQVRILTAQPKPGSWARMGPERAAFQRQLESMPGPQLIMVRYKPDHDSLIEWVYNGADIDKQKVVWARDMGPAQNQELLRYYKDRSAWLLDADDIPPKLSPYPCTLNTATTAAAGGLVPAPESYPCQ